MAMGIVSGKEFDSEFTKLNSEKKREESNSSSPNQVEIIDMNRGRGSNPEVPNSLRKIIGETSVTDGRQEALDLARNFGISPSSVSAYSNGATSTASYNEQPNVSDINKAKERVSKRARNKLMMALSHITEEKLEGSKARDLAGVAKDMSAVIRNMEPEQNKVNESNGPTFVFYSPQTRKEDVFDVVYAKE